MSTPSTPDAAEAARPPKVGLVIVSIGLLLLLAALDQSIVSTALPTIVADLGGLDHLSWVVTAYILSSTVVAPLYGKLGDLMAGGTPWSSRSPCSFWARCSAAWPQT